MAKAKKGAAKANKDVNVFFNMPPWPVREQFLSPESRQCAERLGFKVRVLEPTGPQGAEQLAGVEALITCWGSPKLTAEMLAKADKLKIVGHAAGAVGGIVSPEMYERGIKIVCANELMAAQVAEWSLWVTMMGWNRFTDYAGIGTIREMVWEDREKSRVMPRATVAIWGFGDISRRLVEMLRVVGPKEILVHSGHMKPEEAAKVGVTLCGFDEMFERGDIIHLLGAMTEANKGKVGAKQLAMIKDGSVLVQAGRAHLVQEEALAAEVKKNRFLSILDVHYAEPLAADSPFQKQPGVIVTPHVAGRGREGLYIAYVLEEFDRFFRGEPLRHEVKQDRAETMSGGSGKKPAKG
jgi:phosphoglycerate dehydrogenase-like enzyme